jgi:RNA polymerase sigma-70 factor, ECF subfamily
MPYLMETEPTHREQLWTGGLAAFEQIYRDTRDGVYGLLITTTGRADLAEDLLQETYARFLARMNGAAAPPPLRNVRAYLLRIARNLAVDEARRFTPVTEGLDRLETYEDPDGFAAPGEDDKAETERALRLLRRLPEDQREVIVLRLYNDLSFPEIAGLLGVSIKTLESRYRYGIQKLRSLWKARGGLAP